MADVELSTLGSVIKTAYEGQTNTNAFTDADHTKLDGIETAADVTDATNVDAAGAVMESDFDAQTILLAVSDNTPTALTVAASTFVGRKATGNAGTMSVAEALTLLNVESGADVTDATNVAAAGAKMQGTETIWIAANAMTPATTSGAATGQIESTTNKVNIETLDFDATADEYAHFSIAFPKSWNEGTVTFQVFWSSTGAVTTGVAFGLQAVALADGDAIDTAYGTAVVVTDDAQGTAGDVYVSAASSAVTIAGTPGVNEVVSFRLFRDVSDANDDMTQDAQLIGIKVFFTTDAGNDD